MDTSHEFDWNIPTRTIFGAGSLDKIAELKPLGKKAAIVISNGKSVRANGALERVKNGLRKAGADSEIFDEIQANPNLENIENGAKFVRQNKCDFVVALGGGSVIDAAKSIAAMAANDGELWEYMHGGSGMAKQLKNPPLPIMAITTTAGTGSETDRYSAVTDEKSYEKICLIDDALFPRISIVDPTIMLSLPPKFTAYQGFDALFHATEGYLSKGVNLASDMCAITSIENVAQNLPTAVADGNDLAAREKIAFASMLSGFVICLGRGLSAHSLECAMSAYYPRLPHGAGLIMIADAYYGHLIERGVYPERFVKMAQAMGIKNANKPEDFICALKKLESDCGVDDLKMSDYAIVRGDFAKFVENARLTMPALFAADAKALSDAECMAIFEKSYR